MKLKTIIGLGLVLLVFSACETEANYRLNIKNQSAEDLTVTLFYATFDEVVELEVQANDEQTQHVMTHYGKNSEVKPFLHHFDSIVVHTLSGDTISLNLNDEGNWNSTVKEDRFVSTQTSTVIIEQQHIPQ